MMNITKGDFIGLIASAQSLLYPQCDPETLHKNAQKIYASLIPERQGKTDRLVLSGYMVLLEGSLSYKQIADPSQCQNVNLLLPRKGLELYFQDLLEEGGMSQSQAAVEVGRLLRRFSRPARIHRKLLR